MNRRNYLLQYSSHGGFIPAEDSTLKCSYLHYSTKEFTWIQSGKAVGSNGSGHSIVKRNEEGHVKKAGSASLMDGECF